MNVKRSRLLLPVLAGALALGACDDSTGSDTPRLTIQLTDAPGDLAEAWVNIERIYLQGSGGQLDLLTTPTGFIDLLTLKDDLATIVDEAVVTAGTYSELRFVVCEAFIETEDGTVYATDGADLPAGVTADGRLQAPSACQSGFKVKLPGGSITIEDEAKVLVVDFDVSQTFGRLAGKSGMWVMRPVAHATDAQFSGSIGGTVALDQGVTLPACGGAATDLTNFVPRAIVGTDTIASGATEASGAYKIRFLTPDTYTLGYAPVVGFENGDTLSFTAAATPPSVTVESGKVATSNFTISAASCKPAA